MADGQDLIEQIRKELEPVEARLRDQLYLRALEQSDFERLWVGSNKQNLHHTSSYFLLEGTGLFLPPNRLGTSPIRPSLVTPPWDR